VLPLAYLLRRRPAQIPARSPAAAAQAAKALEEAH
jgi:hypothetical protein